MKYSEMENREIKLEIKIYKIFVLLKHFGKIPLFPTETYRLEIESFGGI